MLELAFVANIKHKVMLGSLEGLVGGSGNRQVHVSQIFLSKKTNKNVGELTFLALPCRILTLREGMLD